MRDKLLKKWGFLFLATFLLLIPAHAQASETQTIYAGFNQITVKVDSQLVESDNLLYEDTTYIPIRNVAEMLGWEVVYYHELKTAYIGMLPAGEVPNEVLDRPENQPAAAAAETSTLTKGFAQIPVIFDSIAIQMHAMPVEASNILYNGTTYVPIRAVAELLEMDVNFYAAASTAYIGKVNPSEVPFEVYKEWYPDAKRPLYAEAATGEMQGWQLLKGHEFEKQFNVYFQVNGTITMTKIEDIRPVDLDKVIHWTDDNGQPRQNTVRELRTIFATFSEYTSDWLYAKFGDVYLDWFASGTFDGEKLVDEYMRQNSQAAATKPPSFVTLTPDAKLVPAEPQPEPEDQIKTEIVGTPIELESHWIPLKELGDKYEIGLMIDGQDSRYFYHYSDEFRTESFYYPEDFAWSPDLTQIKEITAGGIRFKKVWTDIYVHEDDLRAKGILDWMK